MYDWRFYNVNKRKQLCICCIFLFVALSVMIPVIVLAKKHDALDDF